MQRRKVRNIFKLARKHNILHPERLSREELEDGAGGGATQSTLTRMSDHGTSEQQIREGTRDKTADKQGK